MYARITTATVKKEMIDRFIDIFQNSIVPAAKKQKGYRGAYLFVDPNTGRGFSATLWEKKEYMLANEENKYYQQQLLKIHVLLAKDPIRESFEVAVSDLKGVAPQ